ncbi:hypothetical protein [Mariniflexile sp. AS56]|uniref:hypothetical protein n=1 Tax=Mariniflexile sp. AS56 TaxID=3063957 RepID=UPI0026F29818|nr:hypothetical protein [Mariniflexile sp. AS56]MDO7170797.1 hypothetical protein [Mariniflexile sp. AS56]
MSDTLRGIFIATLLIISFSNTAMGQPKKGEFIQASIGLGMSGSYEDYNIIGSGFYVQAEYVMALSRWFGVRPYAGFISTSPSSTNTDPYLSEYAVTSKAFLLGGKARIAAPIPYVAPYLELGIGTSIGNFVTHTPSNFKEKKGIIVHIPFTMGLALGADNGVEIAFTYYFHPTVDQFSGAAALGLSFPINK